MVASIPSHVLAANAESFAAGVRPDAEHLLATYVELMDRGGGMGKVLRLATEARPKTEKLQPVKDAYTRWTETLEEAIERWAGPRMHKR